MKRWLLWKDVDGEKWLLNQLLFWQAVGLGHCYISCSLSLPYTHPVSYYVLNLQKNIEHFLHLIDLNKYNGYFLFVCFYGNVGTKIQCVVFASWPLSIVMELWQVFLKLSSVLSPPFRRLVNTVPLSFVPCRTSTSFATKLRWSI